MANRIDPDEMAPPGVVSSGYIAVKASLGMNGLRWGFKWLFFFFLNENILCELIRIVSRDDSNTFVSSRNLFQNESLKTLLIWTTAILGPRVPVPIIHWSYVNFTYLQHLHSKEGCSVVAKFHPA